MTPDALSQTRAWLTLIRTPGIGPVKLRQLQDSLGGIQQILGASSRQLEQLGLGQKTWEALNHPDEARLLADLEWLSQPDHHLVTQGDAAYPNLLREIPDPPFALFCLGDPALLAQPQIAVIGSRNPTPQGLELARDFACQLASMGLIVTSGLASGIDGAAHQGALSTGRTIAVTGTGLDFVYPARHRELAHRIAGQGALISEFPLGTKAKPGHFPRRNRIISGLSLGVLVIEASQQSGSLITARLAIDQGREVFAIPGSILNPLARGCHQLLREGAKLTENPQDILDELGPLFATLQLDRDRSGNPPEPEDDEGRALLAAMGFDPVTLDELTERTQWPSERLNSIILLLELEGFVSSIPGGRYCRGKPA